MNKFATKMMRMNTSINMTRTYSSLSHQGIRKNNKTFQFHQFIPSVSTSTISTSTSTSSFSTTTTTSSTSSPTLPSLTLYQYAICPFCNINKALLKYVNVPYEHIEVNPLNKKELKPWSGDYKKVPIAKIGNSSDDDSSSDSDDNDNDGDEIEIQDGLMIVKGSSEINEAILNNEYVLQQLQTKWNNNNKNTNTKNNTNMNMDEFQSSQEALKWTTYAKEELAPILYPNICRSLSESYQAFGYVKDVNHFTTLDQFLIRYIGSFAMYIAASKIKSKRNIKDERKALKEAITIWEKEGLELGKKQFSSGMAQPNLGDVAMYGVLHSVHGLDAHDEVMNGNSDGDSNRDGDGKSDGDGNASVVGEWYQRMQKEMEAKV